MHIHPSYATDKVLIVATAQEIKVFNVKRNPRENKLDLEDTGLHIPTDNHYISNIV